MFDIPPILLAGLTGFVSGVILSIPVGPVNLTVLNEGARRGFRIAILISLGATLMESIYCFIAFTGFSSFFRNHGVIKAVMELTSFVLMLALGIHFLKARSVSDPPVELGETASKIEEKIEQRFHPHSAFMRGFVQVMANLGVLVCWVVLAANYISRGWVSPDWPGKLACVGGVFLGTGAWFVILSFGASRGYGRFSEKTLLRMEHFSGICLLALALIHGGRIVWQMMQHRM